MAELVISRIRKFSVHVADTYCVSRNNEAEDGRENALDIACIKTRIKSYCKLHSYLRGIIASDTKREHFKSATPA